MRPPRTIKTVVAQPPPSVYRRYAGVASGGFGFVLGALFWHLIGFWTFVGDVVFKGPVDDRTAQREDIARLPVAQRPTGSISAARPVIAGKGPAAAKAHLTCSIAIPEPADGETAVVPCPPGVGPAPVKPLAKKSDRLPVEVVVSDATPAVQPQAPQQPVAVASPWSIKIKGTTP